LTRWRIRARSPYGGFTPACACSALLCCGGTLARTHRPLRTGSGRAGGAAGVVSTVGFAVVAVAVAVAVVGACFAVAAVCGFSVHTIITAATTGRAPPHTRVTARSFRRFLFGFELFVEFAIGCVQYSAGMSGQCGGGSNRHRRLYGAGYGGRVIGTPQFIGCSAHAIPYPVHCHTQQFRVDRTVCSGRCTRRGCCRRCESDDCSDRSDRDVHRIHHRQHIDRHCTRQMELSTPGQCTGSTRCRSGHGSASEPGQSPRPGHPERRGVRGRQGQGARDLTDQATARR